MTTMYHPGTTDPGLLSPGVNEAVFFDAATKQWLYFKQPRRIIIARSIDEVIPALEEVEQQVEGEGLQAAGYVAYEAGPAFDTALQVHQGGSFPLLWFGLYDKAEPVPLNTEVTTPTLFDWTTSITPEEYRAALGRVREYIASGDTYQVNFTFRLHSPYTNAPFDSFLQLIAAQNPLYGGFLATEDWALCSSSPELFFRLDGEEISSRPMKGTAPRGLTHENDLLEAENLYHSEKNRAENVMIVDMVRNDLGRIAQPGTVNVTELFTIEKYPTLYTMTTQVEASTRSSMVELFQAQFPPASITGAPKARTMEIINELETSPRNIYTGTMGFMLPGRQAQFNVAIRTLLIDLQNSQVEYGLGGGIVWDSDPRMELEECWTKARVCDPQPPPFSLLETLRWQPDSGYLLLEEHLDRLAGSAAYFDYPLKRSEAEGILERAVTELPPNVHRIRILLDKNGDCRTQSFPLDDSTAKPVRVALDSEPIDPKNSLLYHKTTNRTLYEEAKARFPDHDDVLLCNTAGEVTESTIANIVVIINGEWFTPPVRCGLLPGTYRQALLQQGRLKERVITVSMIRNAEELLLINSVRGIYPAKLSP